MEKWEISREVQYFKNRLEVLKDVIELDHKKNTNCFPRSQNVRT